MIYEFVTAERVMVAWHFVAYVCGSWFLGATTAYSWGAIRAYRVGYEDGVRDAE